MCRLIWIMPTCILWWIPAHMVNPSTCDAAWLATFLACLVRKCLEEQGKYWSTGLKFGITNAAALGAPAGVWVPEVLLGVVLEGLLPFCADACVVCVPKVLVCAVKVWVPLLVGIPLAVAVCVPDSLRGAPGLITDGLTWKPLPMLGKPIICIFPAWPWPPKLNCIACGWAPPKAVWPKI